jgi:hypothetical protein
MSTIKHHIFIIHSDTHVDTAEHIRQAINARGFSVVPERADLRNEIQLYDNWLYGQLEQVGVIVVLLAPVARNSRRVREQLEYAIRKQKRIIPILLQGTRGDSTPQGYEPRGWIEIRGDMQATVSEIIATTAQALNMKTQGAPKLNLLNPLAYVQMLRWLFSAPAEYASYRAYAGENSAQRLGAVLTATLVWLPLFMVTVGTSLTMGLAGSWFWALVVLAFWLITALSGVLRDETLGAMGGVGIFFVTMALSFATAGGVSIGPGVPAAIAQVLICTFVAGMAQVLNQELSRSLVTGVAIGTSTGTALLFTNVAYGSVASIFAFVFAVGVSYWLTQRIGHLFEAMLLERRPSRAIQGLFVLVAAAYAVVAWVYLLRGFSS